MFGLGDMWILAGVVLVLVVVGVHVAVALGVTAVLGIYLMTHDFRILSSFIGNTAYEALRDYVFAVLPLFMLMGEFLRKCGAAADLYALCNRMMRLIPGRLAIATVFANALFAFITGSSLAAAAAFSPVAYPAMKQNGYDRRFALGCITGSACLGMLIPPSVLMIVWGVTNEQSIGKLFIAGVFPGFLVVVLYCAYIFWVSLARPEIVGEGPGSKGSRAQAAAARADGTEGERPLGAVFWGTIATLALVLGTLGGIWFGLFTPTEGAAVGATSALLLATAKGLRAKEMFEVILTVGRTSAPLLLLLFAAQLYARTLSMTGITGAAKEFFLASGLGPYEVLTMMILMWFLLGCLIDSISIILLTVPVFGPIAQAMGFDPIAFAIMGILAIETGLLTPPFGLLVFTVKAVLPNEASVGEIFRAVIPYWICLLGAIIAIAIYPQLATWLPSVGIN
jgi:tripartite ATP-independent transporter DctM subunit